MGLTKFFGGRLFISGNLSVLEWWWVLLDFFYFQGVKEDIIELQKNIIRKRNTEALTISCYQQNYHCGAVLWL